MGETWPNSAMFIKHEQFAAQTTPIWDKLCQTNAHALLVCISIARWGIVGARNTALGREVELGGGANGEGVKRSEMRGKELKSGALRL